MDLCILKENTTPLTIDSMTDILPNILEDISERSQMIPFQLTST